MRVHACRDGRRRVGPCPRIGVPLMSPGRRRAGMMMSRRRRHARRRRGRADSGTRTAAVAAAAGATVSEQPAAAVVRHRHSLHTHTHTRAPNATTYIHTYNRSVTAYLFVASILLIRAHNRCDDFNTSNRQYSSTVNLSLIHI